MAMALRSRLSPNSMISRWGSQVLTEPTAFEFSDSLPLNPTPKSVITAMAGFEVAVAFPFVERFSGLDLGLGLRGPTSPAMAGFAASEPVITSMAGFALPSRSHIPGGHISTPAPLRQALMVSRRTGVASWIFRRDHPSRPKAMICCFFSSFKTFTMLREATYPPAAVNVLDASSERMAAFQVFFYGRFWVFTEVCTIDYDLFRWLGMWLGRSRASRYAINQSSRKRCQE